MQFLIKYYTNLVNFIIKLLLLLLNGTSYSKKDIHMTGEMSLFYLLSLPILMSLSYNKI